MRSLSMVAMRVLPFPSGGFPSGLPVWGSTDWRRGPAHDQPARTGHDADLRRFSVIPSAALSRRSSGPRIFVDVLDGLDLALGWWVGFQPDLLAADRHGLGDLILHEHLLEPDALGPPDRLLADRDLLLRAGHGGVGLLARGRSPLATVVLVQGALLLLGELDVRVDVRRLVKEQ